jgi:epoxyqueuosine reductase
LSTPTERSERIKAKARELGFMACGVARAGFLEEEAPRLEKWLRQGHHGSMAYMERHFDMRLDPRQLVPGARSVISLAFNYHTTTKQQDPEAPRISTYAHGRDYHKVLKKRLQPLMAFISDSFGNVAQRAFVDSAPVLEKAWALRAGVGWLGKHTNIIIKPPTDAASSRSPVQSPRQDATAAQRHGGSWFFLCEIITDLEVAPDPPATDHCGTCRRCIDACPTDAIQPYGVDGSRCISYLTIELKEAIPPAFADSMEGWAFGCDICQEVCPWNRFSQPHHESDFHAKPELLAMDAEAWHNMTEVVFDRLFEGSAVKRTKYTGLMRNLRFLRRDANGSG